MIVAITGKNQYQARQDLDRRISEYLRTYGDLSLHNFDGDDLDINKLREATISMPFLSAQSMVILQNVNAAKAYHDDIIQLIADVPDTTEFIVFDTNLDKRTAIYKVLSTRSDFKEYGPRSSFELVDWTINEFNERSQKKVDRRVAQYLVERVGEDEWRLHNEIDKLILFDEISQETIEEAVEPHIRDTIFQLLDATTQKKTGRALEIYKKLLSNRVEPQYILSMIIWQLHIVSVVFAAKDRDDKQISSDHGISPFVVGKVRYAANSLNKTLLRQMLSATAEVDFKLKTTSVDAVLLVEQLIVRLAE